MYEHVRYEKLYCLNPRIHAYGIRSRTSRLCFDWPLSSLVLMDQLCVVLTHCPSAFISHLLHELLKNVLAMMKVIQVIDSSYQVLYLVYLTSVHVTILLPSCYSVKWWNRIKCDWIILNSALTVKLYFSAQV